MKKSYVVGALAVLPLVLSGCGGIIEKDTSGSSDASGSGKSGKASRNIAIKITDDGCEVAPATISAGATHFKVQNQDAKKVTEAELMNGEGRILAEAENLTPGLRGSFSVNLEGGKYDIYCPGASAEKVRFSVTGKAVAAKVPKDIGEHLKRGTSLYAVYVKDQTKQLVKANKAFTDAVRAGDIEKAKKLYGPARVFWERIEPVAESFGDLDPAVDARINDVKRPSDWTGYHPLEKALWVDKTTKGTKRLADKLDADIARLDALVQKTTYQPADLANGATTLLAEVAGTKITGEEERYSRIDLLDMWANIDGAKRAFELLSPALNRIDKALVAKIETRFTEVNQELGKYREGSSFRSYDKLSKAEIKGLADKVDALAEPLSQVAAKVVSYK